MCISNSLYLTYRLMVATGFFSRCENSFLEITSIAVNVKNCSRPNKNTHIHFKLCHRHVHCSARYACYRGEMYKMNYLSARAQPIQR